jgi:hypothetical protein
MAWAINLPASPGSLRFYQVLRGSGGVRVRTLRALAARYETSPDLCRERNYFHFRGAIRDAQDANRRLHIEPRGSRRPGIDNQPRTIALDEGAVRVTKDQNIG